MTDEKIAVEPSAAATPIQYDGWDEHGTPIVTKKPDQPKKSEEPAASASSTKETQSEPKGKTAAEPETAPSQEKKDRKPGEKKSAEERIAELTAKVKQLEDERERSRAQATQPAPKTETKAEEKPKDAQPATYAEWRKAFKPKEWIEQWAKDNPSAGYEDAVAALGDYQADIRDRYRQFEQLKADGVRRSQEQLRKTVEKYPDAEPKVKEAAKSLMNPEVPPFVRAFIDESEVMTDLLYTLADPKTLENLLETAKTAPGKALRVLRDMESDIQKSIAKPPATEKEEKKEKKEPPAEPKPRAPKPPTEVGGRGTGQEDASVAAARTGNFRDFEAAENAKMRAKFARA